MLTMLKTLRQYAAGLVVGALLSTAVVVFAQSGPYAAQIQSAINALLTGGYTFTNISVTGGSISGVTTTLPAGGALTWTGRSQITSPADGQLLFQNNAGTDFARLMFGGTTASFPAIKRNGSSIEFRLADDSGQAALLTNSVGANAGGSVGGIQFGRIVTNQTEIQSDINRFNLTNTAGTTGALIDTSTDGTLKILTRAAANTAFVQASAFQGATANLVRLGGATGIEFNTNGVTLGTCGTGAVTTGSRGSGGEVTATGATTCSVNFTTSFTNTPFCTMDDETTVGGRISATAAGSVTFAGLTAGDKVSWTCTGWF